MTLYEGLWTMVAGAHVCRRFGLRRRGPRNPGPAGGGCSRRNDGSHVRPAVAPG